MVKVKTADLIGKALDWAVAETEGGRRLLTTVKEFGSNVAKRIVPDYSTSWLHCGPLIEKNKVGICDVDSGWVASIMAGDQDRELYAGLEMGETPLIAICRAVVASKLGDEVDIPDKLTN